MGIFGSTTVTSRRGTGATRVASALPKVDASRFQVEITKRNKKADPSIAMQVPNMHPLLL